MASISLSAVVEVSVADSAVKSHGSPTTEVRQALVRSVCGSTPGLGSITRLALVDSAGTERDSTTSLSFSVGTVSVDVTGSLTASASYTVSKVRAYSGTTMYFETSLTAGVSVTAGQTVNIRLTITSTLYGSITFGGQSFGVSNVNYNQYVVRFLAGQITDISYLTVNILEIPLYHDTTPSVVYSATLSRSLSADQLRCTHSASVSDISAGTIRSFDIKNSRPTPEYLWSLVHSTGVSVPSGTRVDFTAEFTA